MNNTKKQESFNKYYTMTSIINNLKDEKFFKQLDACLLKKRFDNAYELSVNENILHIDTYNLTNKSVLKIFNEFILNSYNENFLEKRNLFEIVKLSAIATKKLSVILTNETHYKLIETFNILLAKTNLISLDFLILRCVDNFILKNHDINIINSYILLKKKILKKLIDFDYIEEKKEKETTLLCWIDRILNAIINEEIKPNDFVLLNKKIFQLTSKSVYSFWKVLHAINYLLLQPEYSTSVVIKNFRKEIIEQINLSYSNTNLSLEEVQNLVISTLAKKDFSKEDFYYLFDIIKLTAQKNDEYMLQCLKLCKYIIKNNNKQNIFCFRFIRKYFLETFFAITDISSENIKIKEEELAILIALFHVDAYFCFNRREIFNKIVVILKTINNGKNKLTKTNFFRYCDVLDYIMSENPDIFDKNIIKSLSYRNKDESKIKAYFNLNTSLFSNTEATKNII